MEKAYDRVNSEALWQVLRMFDVGGTLQSRNKNIYFNVLACVRAKGSESEYFHSDSGVRQDCIISPWIFNVYMNPEMKEMKIRMGRR